MISINQIFKQYNGTVVLDNITTKIPKGGITSIIGSNGAGKSTLLCLIGRLLMPNGGNIKVGDLDVFTANNDALAKCLSILRQDNQFTMRLTVEELVGFGRFPYTKGRLNFSDKQKITDALDFLNLLDLRHRYLDELSGGQRQRAYVAMVLCQDTDYVLLDEPLNNLDMKHAALMMKRLRRAAKELGKTIILVIHDINFASVYSNHLLAMKQGKVLYQGSPSEIMKPDVLEDVFDLALSIKKIDNQLIALYY